jgi:hypothetical protein
MIAMYLRATGTHRLYEAALATEFGVSKTHVREALSVFAQPAGWSSYSARATSCDWSNSATSATSSESGT